MHVFAVFMLARLQHVWLSSVSLTFSKLLLQFEEAVQLHREQTAMLTHAAQAAVSRSFTPAPKPQRPLEARRAKMQQAAHAACLAAVPYCASSLAPNSLPNTRSKSIPCKGAHGGVAMTLLGGGRIHAPQTHAVTSALQAANLLASHHHGTIRPQTKPSAGPLQPSSPARATTVSPAAPPLHKAAIGGSRAAHFALPKTSWGATRPAGGFSGSHAWPSHQRPDQWAAWNTEFARVHEERGRAGAAGNTRMWHTSGFPLHAAPRTPQMRHGATSVPPPTTAPSALQGTPLGAINGLANRGMRSRSLATPAEASREHAKNSAAIGQVAAQPKRLAAATPKPFGLKSVWAHGTAPRATPQPPSPLPRRSSSLVSTGSMTAAHSGTSFVTVNGAGRGRQAKAPRMSVSNAPSAPLSPAKPRPLADKLAPSAPVATTAKALATAAHAASEQRTATPLQMWGPANLSQDRAPSGAGAAASSAAGAPLHHKQEAKHLRIDAPDAPPSSVALEAEQVEPAQPAAADTSRAKHAASFSSDEAHAPAALGGASASHEQRATESGSAANSRQESGAGPPSSEQHLAHASAEQRRPETPVLPAQPSPTATAAASIRAREHSDVQPDVLQHQCNAAQATQPVPHPSDALWEDSASRSAGSISLAAPGSSRRQRADDADAQRPCATVSSRASSACMNTDAVSTSAAPWLGDAPVDTTRRSPTQRSRLSSADHDCSLSQAGSDAMDDAHYDWPARSTWERSDNGVDANASDDGCQDADGGYDDTLEHSDQTIAREAAEDSAAESAPTEHENDHIVDGVRVLGGKYHVEKLVGEGAYGRVMRCSVAGGAPGARVAVKEFKISDSDPDAEDVKRTAHREAALMRQLAHRHVVACLDAFLVRDRLFIVMEFMPLTLLDLLESTSGGGGLQPAVIRRAVYQLVKVMTFIHAQVRSAAIFSVCLDTRCID